MPPHTPFRPERYSAERRPDLARAAGVVLAAPFSRLVTGILLHVGSWLEAARAARVGRWSH